MLSEAQAAAIWRRAAQLQAEAASRLERESAEASRPVEGPNPSSGYGARDVPQALGRALQGHPYNLVLADQLGGHPLDGGIHIDLRPGLTANVWGSGAMGATGSIMGGVITAAILKKAAFVGLIIGGGAAWAAALLGDALSILPPPPPAETTRQTR